MMRRLGDSEGSMLTVQANIVNTLEEVGRAEEHGARYYSGTFEARRRGT